MKSENEVNIDLGHFNEGIWLNDDARMDSVPIKYSIDCVTNVNCKIFTGFQFKEKLEPIFAKCYDKIINRLVRHSPLYNIDPTLYSTAVKFISKNILKKNVVLENKFEIIRLLKGSLRFEVKEGDKNGYEKLLFLMRKKKRTKGSHNRCLGVLDRD